MHKFKTIRNTMSFLVIFITIFSCTSSYGQENQNSEQVLLDSLKKEWWFPILSKHGIELKNYDKYNYIYVLGDRQIINDTLLAYENSIILSTGKEYLTITEKCDTVHYNVKSQKLKMERCYQTSYKRDFSVIDPYRKSDIGIYEIDFKKNRSLITSSKPEKEILKEVGDIFEKSINALETIDTNFLRETIRDDSDDGFIINGLHYYSVDTLFNFLQKGIKSQKLNIIEKKITILSDKSVLLTTRGEYAYSKNPNQTIHFIFYGSLIYRKENNKWKLIHAHISNLK